MLDKQSREEFELPEGKALLREWGLPEHLVGVGHCIVGYGDGPERLRLREKTISSSLFADTAKSSYRSDGGSFFFAGRAVPVEFEIMADDIEISLFFQLLVHNHGADSAVSLRFDDTVNRLNGAYDPAAAEKTRISLRREEKFFPSNPAW